MTGKASSAGRDVWVCSAVMARVKSNQLQPSVLAGFCTLRKLPIRDTARRRRARQGIGKWASTEVCKSRISALTDSRPTENRTSVPGLIDAGQWVRMDFSS